MKHQQWKGLNPQNPSLAHGIETRGSSWSSSEYSFKDCSTNSSKDPFRESSRNPSQDSSKYSTRNFFSDFRDCFRNSTRESSRIFSNEPFKDSSRNTLSGIPPETTPGILQEFAPGIHYRIVSRIPSEIPPCIFLWKFSGVSCMYRCEHFLINSS